MAKGKQKTDSTPAKPDKLYECRICKLKVVKHEMAAHQASHKKETASRKLDRKSVTINRQRAPKMRIGTPVRKMASREDENKDGNDKGGTNEQNQEGEGEINRENTEQEQQKGGDVDRDESSEEESEKGIGEDEADGDDERDDEPSGDDEKDDEPSRDDEEEPDKEMEDDEQDTGSVASGGIIREVPQDRKYNKRSTKSYDTGAISGQKKSTGG